MNPLSYSKTAASTQASQAEAVSFAVEESEQKQPKFKKRSTGLWVFDALLYPVFTNVVVFVISVYATFMTKHGGTRRTQEGWQIQNYETFEKDGVEYIRDTATNHEYAADKTKLIYGKFGFWLNRRGEKVMDWLTKKKEDGGWFGWSEGTADMAKMVTFSFLDGSLVAPFVKLLEDRREKIAYGIDQLLGTVPEDKSVYEAEPKQSWLSVFGGRLATVSIVVPTAVMLEKIGQKEGKWVWNTEKDNPGFTSLNDKLFNTPGLKHGMKLQNKHPETAAKLGKHVTDIPYLFKTLYFEAFYTTVCTIGLYISSRLFARWGEKKKPTEETPPIVATRKSDTAPATRAAHQPEQTPEQEKPRESSTSRTAPLSEKFSERNTAAAAAALLTPA